jgi:hypothetical protein
VLRGRQPVKAKAFVFRRDGFKGPVRLEGNEFVRFSPETVPADSNRMDVAVIFRGKGPVSPRTTKLFASATVDGGTCKVEIVPSDEYNQAFAWDHLLPSRDFVLRHVPGSGGGKNGKDAKKKPNGNPGKAKGDVKK